MNVCLLHTPLSPLLTTSMFLSIRTCMFGVYMYVSSIVGGPWSHRCLTRLKNVCVFCVRWLRCILESCGFISCWVYHICEDCVVVKCWNTGLPENWLLGEGEKGKTHFCPGHWTWAQRLASQCTKHQAITLDKVCIPILPYVLSVVVG